MCVVAPPFYFGGTQAMTRQFAGTFTSSVENITAAVNDIHASAFETALAFVMCAADLPLV